MVVTGASKGLGAAFAEALIARGATVFGLARNTEKLTAVQTALGPAFHPIACDVQDEAAVQNAFAQIFEKTDRVDVLVNNAGLGRFGPIEQATLDDWRVQIETNLTGVFLCTRAIVPHMKQRAAGCIVNIASVSGLVANPYISIYNTTKFGLRGFTEALMKELRHDGIKVICMYPGSIDTPFFDDIPSVEAGPHMMQPEDVAQTLVHVLAGSDNYLVSEVMMRPLRPKR